MSSKAIIIKKKVILITKNTDLKTLTPVIKTENFNECYLFNNTHSIRKENRVYYCKNNDFYCDANYCLILDVSKENEALNHFVKTIKIKLKKDIDSHRQSISKLETQLINLKHRY